MSGIVGLLHRGDMPVDPSLLQRLTDTLAPCGPDRRDVWLDGRVGLGHALLRTTFESARERQPRSLDGQVWITADARIDNRAETIDVLRARGRDVTADVLDVDLILHAYATWGEDCPEHLLGDFAFVLWDGPRRRLFCARDQFGVIPLYYAETANGWIVSNVLDCLRRHPAISDALNEHVIGDFLLFNMNMDVAATTFADIRSLPPAHTWTWADGHLRIRRYWHMPEERDYVRYRRPEEYVERFRSLFRQAVGDRLRTDRVGVQLSGGMDSSSITVTARELLGARPGPFDLRAYTIVYERLFAEEEGRYADMIARHIDVPAEHLVAEQYLTSPPETTPGSVFPEPSVIANHSAEWEISKRISSFSRVQLVGFGGDPLLGAGRSWPAWTAAPAQWGHLLRGVWLTATRYHRLPRLRLRTALRRALRGRSPAASPRTVPDWLNPGFARRVHLSERLRQVTTELQTLRGPRRMLAPLWVNLFTWSHPGFSGLPLKTLFPFFDLRLARYLLTVPPLPWREDKRLLRDAMRGSLPEEVRRRPKTPLWTVRSGMPDADQRVHWNALQSVTLPWRRSFLCATPMSSYVDAERALAVLESPASVEERRALEPCFPLAYWLQQKRGTDETKQHTKEMSHA